MTEWQPIDSAPRDGTPVLGYVPRESVPWRVLKWMRFCIEEADGEWFDAAMEQPVDNEDLFFAPIAWKPLEPPAEPTA